MSSVVIRSGYSLCWPGGEVDLHNDYDFTGIEFSLDQSKLSLRWTKTEGAWTTESDPKMFEIVFEKLSLGIITRAVEEVPSSTLEFAGYLHAEDSHIMGGYLELEEVTGAYHYIFGFEGGLVIKIAAESILVRVAGD